VFPELVGFFNFPQLTFGFVLFSFLKDSYIKFFVIEMMTDVLIVFLVWVLKSFTVIVKPFLSGMWSFCFCGF